MLLISFVLEYGLEPFKDQFQHDTDGKFNIILKILPSVGWRSRWARGIRTHTRDSTDGLRARREKRVLHEDIGKSLGFTQSCSYSRDQKALVG